MFFGKIPYFCSYDYNRQNPEFQQNFSDSEKNRGSTQILLLVSLSAGKFLVVNN